MLTQLPLSIHQVLEKYSFEDIGEVSTSKHSGLQLVTHQGERIVLTTEKAAQIKELINSYIVESNGGGANYDYVRALADFSSRDENMLKFRKGEIVAVVPKRDAYTEKVYIFFYSFFVLIFYYYLLLLFFRAGCTASRRATTASSPRTLSSASARRPSAAR